MSLFALKKNADPDIPILKQAKEEYAKLEVKREWVLGRAQHDWVNRRMNLL